MTHAARLLLWTLLAAGLYGALAVSYTTLTGDAPCPTVAALPVCYLVALAYAGMILSLFRPGKVRSTALFLTGWIVAFGFAATGSGLELIQGNICPTTEAGLPLCYVSLLFCVLILAAWTLLQRRSARAASPA